MLTAYCSLLHCTKWWKIVNAKSSNRSIDECLYVIIIIMNALFSFSLDLICVCWFCWRSFCLFFLKLAISGWQLATQQIVTISIVDFPWVGIQNGTQMNSVLCSYSVHNSSWKSLNCCVFLFSVFSQIANVELFRRIHTHTIEKKLNPFRSSDRFIAAQKKNWRYF